jgi:hypothetical protein
MSTTEFTPYTCSLGTVTGHEGNAYLIATADGRTLGIPANGEPSPAAVEADIANPPVVRATPADIAAHRYEIETGGILYTLPNGVGTHRFDTTRENRVMWLAMQGLATAHPGMTQAWKTLEGDFVTLTAADILAIVTAIFAHIAACFAIEAALLAAPPALADLPAAFSAAR